MTRFGYVMTTYFSVLAIGALSFVSITPKLIWNASASAPVGLYTIRPPDRLEVLDLVAVAPPEPLEQFLDQRGYLPSGVPLLKRVAALPGQRVCRRGDTVTVDGIAMASAREHDRLGRALPVWAGCRRVAQDEVFLMNWEHPDSLDGRYFGPLPASSVIGRAIPLYTDEDGTDRYEWCAPMR